MSTPPALPLSEPPGRGPLRVGFSGGLDSSALLHRLAQGLAAGARTALRAIHVHHGLEPQADAWAAHCEAACAALGVGIDIVHVDVDRRSGEGLEAAARHARYAAFAAHLPVDGVLALGHHQADQAETFLLRALRASGPDGLAGIPAARPFAGGWLWRPLLAQPREALLAYATAHGLRWIEDPGNTRDDADRNFLRNRVLPLLRQRWPDAGAAFSTAAALQADTVALLDDEDARALADARTLDPAVLRIQPLQALPAPRLARVLRRWSASLALAPLPASGAAWCATTLARPADDRQPRFDWAGCRLQRWRGLLHGGRPLPPLPDDFARPWNGAAPLHLPGGGLLSVHGEPPAAMPWRVHARRGGERIRLPGRAHSHTLRHVLQALAIPPWVRAQLPLLSDADGRLLAAGDLAFDAHFDAWLREHRLGLRWTPAAGP